MHQKKSPITDLTDEYVQQVWGEAVWLYKNTKNPFILSENAQKLLEENNTWSDPCAYMTDLQNSLGNWHKVNATLMINGDGENEDKD